MDATYDIRSGASGVLHRGLHSIVFKAKHKKTGDWRAVKQVRKDDPYIEIFRQELDLARHCDHPHICRLFETIDDKKHLCAVMELCQGRNLLGIGAVDKSLLTEGMVSVLVRQMVSAVTHLHDQGFCHMDLRPESFVFTKTLAKGVALEDICLKLVDVGSAAARSAMGAFSPTESGTTSGTTTGRLLRSPRLPAAAGGKADSKSRARNPCMAPELWNEKVTCSPQCDVWSLGCMAFYLLAGAWPRQECKEATVPLVPETVWTGVSYEACSFVTSCLTISPPDRPTGLQLLASPWMVKAKDAFERYAKERARSSVGKRNILDTPLMSADAIITGFKNMAKLNELERAAITAVAYRLPEDKIAHLRMVFEKLDTNGDGTLSVSEIREGLKGARKNLGSDEEVQNILGTIDTDGSGRIDYTEFVAATYQCRRTMGDGLCESAFGLFDADGSGQVSADEVAHLLGADEFGRRNSGIDRAIASADTNGNGMLDFKEFKAVLKGDAGDNQPRGRR